MQGYAKNTVSDLVKVQSGTVTAQAAFTISSLTAGAKYRLMVNLTQNTAAGIPTLTFNGDTGANYASAWGYHVQGGANGVAAVTQTSIAFMGGYSLTAGTYWYGEYTFQPLSGNNNYMTVFGHSGSFLSVNSAPCSNSMAGQYSGSASISSMTITLSAGTVTGNWTLYQLS